MDAMEIIEPLRRMADAMHRQCRRIERLREQHGRWSVPVTRAECTVVWFMRGCRPVPGDKVPNGPHEGPGAASSRTVPLDAVVGPQTERSEG